MYADRVKDTTTAPGTGTITLANVAPAGYQTFATAFTTGTLVSYCIADQSGTRWEVGTGTFTAPATLTRTTVLASSAAGAKVDFATGTQDVFCTAPAKYLEVAGATTQIQYNNAGVFGASSLFTYTSGTNTLTTGNLTGSALAMTIQPLAPTSGSAGALTVQARAGVATNGAGGALNLTAGAGAGTGTGGAVNITAGANPSFGIGGSLSFTAGNSQTGTAGSLSFTAGDVLAGTGSGGGNVTFTGGAASGGGNMTFTAGARGGAMTFTAGGGTTGQTGGDLTFSAGGYFGSSPNRGGNLTFSSGSSDDGPAGEFACLTGVGTTSSGDVRLETGFVSGGQSGDINLITGVSGLSVAANAGNLVYTGGQTGNDADDFSGTGGGLIFTGGYGYGSAGVGGSFTFTAGGGNATQGSINLATVSGTSIRLADNGGRQLGFFGATPVAKPTVTGSRATGAALVSLLTQLAALGLITNSTTA
jgi:hypothetical protein